VATGIQLYAVDSRFSAAGTPLAADLFIAHKIAQRRDGAFERAADSDDLFRLVNTAELEYAPAVSSDGLERLHARPRDSRRCRAAHLAFRPAQRRGAVCRAPGRRHFRLRGSAHALAGRPVALPAVYP